MAETKSTFGNYQNQDIYLYTLSNDTGMELKITNYGATITSFIVPNKNG